MVSGSTGSFYQFLLVPLLELQCVVHTERLPARSAKDRQKVIRQILTS